MSLPRAPVRLTTCLEGQSPILHAADLTDDYGTAWCGTLPPGASICATFRTLDEITYGSVCPDCERLYQQRYPDPATFNVHTAADGVVPTVLLQQHNDLAPGE